MFADKKLGVEFSQSKIKFLYTTRKGHVIDSTVCEIGDELDATEALREYISRIKPRARNIQASVNIPQTVIRFWEPRYVPKHNLDKAFRLNIGAIFPIDMSGYTVAYKVLRPPPDAVLMAAAIPTSMSREIVLTFKRNGLTLTNIDIYQNCIAKYFASVGETDAALFYRYAGRLYFIFLSNGFISSVRDFAYLAGDATEIRNFFHCAGVSFKKVYFIGEKDEPVPPGVEFPNYVCVENSCGGFEGLHGLLK